MARHLLICMFACFLGIVCHAQDIPTQHAEGNIQRTHFHTDTVPDTVTTLPLTADTLVAIPNRDSILRAEITDSLVNGMFADSLTALHNQLAWAQKQMHRLSSLRDSLVMANSSFQQQLEEKNALLEDKIRALQEKERMVAEKEQLYREALSSSNVDKAKLEGSIQAKEISIAAKSREIDYLQHDIDAKESSLTSQREAYERLALEKERYRHLVDSLRNRVITADQENIRKQEENKYLAQRAKDAEEKVAAATNRKKKVRPTQGIAMRMFRTPDWNIRLTPQAMPDGSTDYYKEIWNRNAGSIEFDYVTGASVMLWDLSKYFNKDDSPKDDSISKIPLPEIRRFDQQFAYDLGLYVGFGGSNLFKNFYVGPSFRFVDFFYLTLGINVSEYEVLTAGYTDGQQVAPAITLSDITAKSWLIKPFISLSIDLDFLSYIKR